MALALHPDKNPDDEKAAENFQKLSKAYKVLSDPKKRQKYDEFGDDGEGDDFGGTDWLEAYNYYRSMHPEISKADVKSYAERFKGSAEEQDDLIEFYEEHEGDVTNILQHIICSTNEDLPKYMEFFDAQIKSGNL